MSRYYNSWPSHKIKYKFKDYQSVSETYSQAYQDIFVLTVLNGQRQGFYLEIGCNVPDHTNNTYLLSKQYNWTGVSIDFLADLEPAWKAMRPKDLFLACDAFSIDYAEMLADCQIVDYLQLDIDPAPNTLALLNKLPLSTHRFRVITFETDIYAGQSNHIVREQSRKILTDHGYTLVVGDVLVDSKLPYEDWWVDLNLTDKTTVLEIQDHAKSTQDPRALLFDIGS